MADPSTTNNQEEDGGSNQEEDKTYYENVEPNDLDLLIAIRKGVRSSAKNFKYPISDYVEYSKLSRNFKAFFAKIDEIQIPNNIHEALQDQNWKKVVIEEMKELNETCGTEVVYLM